MISQRDRRTSPHVNQLFYGDNLDVLRKHIPPDSVDLVYLDPPFNSNQDYNVLFKEQSGEPAQAQIKAFTDTWEWSEKAYAEFCETCPNRC
jgi:adenine specific DNA methylase Mod